MIASGKNPPGYWGIALRFIALLPKFPSGNKCVRSLFLGLLLALAMPAHAASTIAASKLWCAWGAHYPAQDECLYSSDAGAGQADMDFMTLHYGLQIHEYFLTGCDGNGLCSYYVVAYDPSTHESSVSLTGDFQLRYLTTCPANSSPNGTDCTCNTNYVADSAGTSCILPSQCTAPNVVDPKTGQCGPADTCPQVKALTPLPANDACAQALENLKTTQAQKDAACGTLSTAMKAGKSCLADKLSRTPNAANPIPLKVTADIRDIAYQAHLREIWDKMQALLKLEDDPVQQTACAARRAEIAAEKGCNNGGRCESCYAESATQRSHCLKGRPSSSNDAPHTKGNALDVSEASTIAPLKRVLNGRRPPQNIQQFLDGPPDCKLNWGGMFPGNYDPIHFQVR
jgi:hypothetical protein